MILEVKKYYPKEMLLKNLIKYFWVIDSDQKIAVQHKVLPNNSIDFIINLSSPIQYCRTEKLLDTPGNCFFSGIRNQPLTMYQTGKIFMIGISFFPAGLYPFLKIPISEFKNKTLELDSVVNKFSLAINRALSRSDSVQDKIQSIEQYLISLLDIMAIPDKNIDRLIRLFFTSHSDIMSFCKKYAIHQKKLDRIFNKYIGIGPKFFYRLSRFQEILNRILEKDFKDLTSTAYDHNFYDQTHFIKDFKAFTGSSPSKFLNEKQSFKQILKYS